MQLLVWSMFGGAGIALSGLGLWLLHCFAIKLEDAGYIYYREKPQGGGGGSVLGELDKLVRPSIQHTVEVQDVLVETDEIDGD